METKHRYLRVRRRHGRYTYSSFFLCLWILWAIALTVAVIVALVFAADFHWERDSITSNIISKHTNADVEVRSGNDLVVHNRIIHSGSDVMAEKITFSPPVFFPTGDDFVFGDQNIAYARLQAGLAIGFRLGTFSGIAPGMFLQPDLKVLIEPAGVHISSFLFPFFGIFIPSDERIKTNITDMDSVQALRNVLSLRPKTYYYEDWWYEQLGEDDDQFSKPKRRGFVAQDVEKVLPNSVKEINMALNGKMTEDFRDLRKEDLVTEVVSAVQHIYYESVLETAYTVFYPGDPFSQVNGGNSIPTWAEPGRACFNATFSSQIQVECVCDKVKTICQTNTGIQLCDIGHPLQKKCLSTFT